jgi:hypothetical protein
VSEKRDRGQRMGTFRPAPKPTVSQAVRFATGTSGVNEMSRSLNTGMGTPSTTRDAVTTCQGCDVIVLSY